MYSWDFNGDYEEDSDVGNPTFTYATPGTYTVTLIVTNSGGTDYDNKIGYITVNAVQTPPIAAFSAYGRSGNAPLTVTFNDQSTGASPLTYLWDFTNDGQNTSSLKNPQFTYTTPGTYTVKLTVTNHLGSDIATKTNYILVTEGQSGPMPELP